MQGKWMLLIPFLVSLCFLGSYSVSRGKRTFHILGIFDFFREDGALNVQTGFMAYVGLKLAIDQANKDPRMIEYGYNFNLSHVIQIRPLNTDDIVEIAKRTIFENKYISFIIGPRYSSQTLSLSLRLNIPVYSYGAISTIFDSKMTDCNFPIKSIVPSNTYRFQALISFLINDQKWNYFAIISSLGYDGGDDAKKFVRKLANKEKVCVTETSELKFNSSIEDIERRISKIEKVRAGTGYMRALVLFTTDYDSRKILIALRNLKLEKRFTLVFVYGSALRHEVVEGYEDIALGALSLSYNIDHFSEWNYIDTTFPKLTPENFPSPYFHLYWESFFKCKLNSQVIKGFNFPNRKHYNNNCTGNETLPKTSELYKHSLMGRTASSMTTINEAVTEFIYMKCGSALLNCSFQPDPNIDETYTTEIRNLICEKGPNSRFFQYPNLKAQSYHPNVYGVAMLHKTKNEYSNQWVYAWVYYYPKTTKYPFYVYSNMFPEEALHYEGSSFSALRFYDKLDWGNNTLMPPPAICSEECKKGFIKKTIFIKRSKSCCWECIKCPKNNIIFNNETCEPCLFGFQANLDTNKCETLPSFHLDFWKQRNVFMYILLSISLAGIASVVFVVIIFIKYNQNHIVRAAGRDLSYSILFGITTLFICPFLFLTKPNDWICAFRDILPNLSFLLCYAALCLKATRIYRIFESAKTRISRPILITPCSQLVILWAISIIQFLVSGMWFINESPGDEKLLAENERFLTHHCKETRNFAKFFVNLTPSIAFMLSSAFLAFKTRNFPKNYNEAKYVAVTLFVTLICWCSFIPIFVFPKSSDTFFSEYSMSILCIVIGYVTLVGLFSHKLALLYQNKPIEDQDSFRSRARSISSSHKDGNMNESNERLNDEVGI